MSDLDSIWSCSLGGGGGASFSLEDLQRSADPIIKDNCRVGTQIKVTAVGRLMAADVGTLAAALRDADDSLSISGQDFTVRLGNAIEYQLPAARCTDGGPHVAFELSSGDSSVDRVIRFTLTAQTGGDTASEPLGAVSSTMTETTRPDGTRDVTIRGTFIRADARTWFFSTLRPGFLAAYPRPQWKTQHELAFEGTNKCTYTLSAEEYSAALPLGGGDATATVFEGEHAVSVEADGSGRRLEIDEWELSFAGDEQHLIDQIRPRGDLQRESTRVTQNRERRLSARFEVLADSDGSGLLTWQQSLHITRGGGGNVFELKQYPGSDPVLVRKPKGVTVIVQEGSGTGLGDFLLAPDPLYPEALLEDPDVQMQELSPTEKQTTWRYVMALDAAATEPSPWVISRPTGRNVKFIA